MIQRGVRFLILVFFFISLWGAVASQTAAEEDRFVGTNHFVKIAEKIKPSVVNITLTRPTEPKKSSFRLLFDKFLGKERTNQLEDFFTYILFQEYPERTFMEKLAGSGIVIQSDGLILTNDHVVTGQGTLEVILADGRRFSAKIVGRDYLTDLALIKIEVENLPIIRLGNSEDLRVGEWVLAIGNSLGLQYTVSAGIVSAKGRNLPEEGTRPYFNMIQTDAPINLGNSGGPLVNMRGEVIGVNTSIIPGGQSIGFATPVDQVKEVLPALITTGEVKRGWVGFIFQTPKEAKDSSVINRVFTGGPAEKAGLRSGDTILSINGIAFDTQKDVSTIIKNSKIGSHMSLLVQREKQTVPIDVIIEQMLIPEFRGRRVYPSGFEGFILKLPMRTRWLLIVGAILFIILLIDVNRDIERKKWKTLERGKERRSTERRAHVVPVEEIRVITERRESDRRAADRRHKKFL